MSITNGYATVEEFKLGFLPSGVTDSEDDTLIERVIEAASRKIDHYCRRRFFTTTSDETRYFTAQVRRLLDTPDIVSVTTLKTDDDGNLSYETTWTTSDYILLPLNASLDSIPYNQIAIAPNGSYRFPLSEKGIQVVGKFGWSAVPVAVKEACLLQARRLFKRKDAIFGVVGSAEMGQLQVIPKIDPDVELLLQPYVFRALV